MCNAGAYSDAAVQLEKALEYYRHLHLSSVGDEASKGSGSISAHYRQAKRSAAARSKEGTDKEDKGRLDFCPHIYSILVEAYYNTDHHRATSVAREWVEKYPKNVSPHCSLAWVQMKQLQYTDCISTCTNAINNLPETEGVMALYSIRGKCRVLLEQYEEAVNDFKYVKEMENKNLARFAPEKAVFFKLDRASRPSPQLLAPKSRPDIALSRKYGNRLSTATASPLGSLVLSRQVSASPDAWDLQPLAERKGAALHLSETLGKRAQCPGAKRREPVNAIRNYEVRSDARRMCARCQPKRDPITRRSITNMRMGLSTDERRGASPSRVLLLADVAPDRPAHK